MDPFQALFVVLAAVIIGILGITMSAMILFIALAPILGIYFIPTIIAFYRGTEHRWWIFGINAIFGSTGIGWIGSLIWAFVDKKEGGEEVIVKEEAITESK